jgi:hypothetical protein
VPAADGRKLAVQVAVPAIVPVERVQGLDVPKDPVAVPAGVKATVPRGVVGLPLVSVTVTVQVESWFTTTGVSQLRLVVVAWAVAGLTVILKARAVLLPL